VAPRRNEVKTAVHTVISNVPTIQTSLAMKIFLKLVVNVFDDGTKAVKVREGLQFSMSFTRSVV
jgi:hypothetical protein